MTFRDDLKRRDIPVKYTDDPPESRLVLTTTEQTEISPDAPAGIPKGLNQIVELSDKFMPLIEKMTGLHRREISLQVLKSALSGKGFNGILGGLMGTQPEKPSRFEKYVKTLAIWIPVSLGLFGLVVVGLILLYKLVMIVI